MFRGWATADLADDSKALNLQAVAVCPKSESQTVGRALGGSTNSTNGTSKARKL